MSRVETFLLTPVRQLRSSYGRGLLVGLLIHVVASVSASSWPQPPYSVEQIEAFANPDDLEVLYDLSFNQNELNGKQSIHYATAFLEEYEPKVREPGMVTLLFPGAKILNVDEGSRESAQHQHRKLTSLPHPTWNSEGRLVNMKAFSPIPEDLALFNKLNSLSALYFEGLGSDRTLDLSLLSAELPLRVVYAFHSRFSNVQSLCEINSLNVIAFTASRVEGRIDTSLCPETFQVLTLATVQIDQLSIAQSPQLTLLNLSGSQIVDSLVLDSSSLPLLKSLNLSESDIPSDISAIQLPETLVQIFLRKATDRDLSRLELPENLQYIDLQDAQLGDYNFLEKARNLTALNLEGSDFTQWSMLKQFSKLEHLKVGMTNFSDSDMQYISKLENLKSLDLGLTNITSAKPLKDLTALSFLSLPQTKITDLEEIPFIPNLSYLGLPRIENYENRSNWPDAVRRMMETSGSGLECNGLKPCELPPWFE